MAVKPIKPSEVAKAKLLTIPDEVIEAFNELIAKNYASGSSVVLQKDAVRLIRTKMICRDVTDLCEWLNVEEVYRKAGWIVKYDKPGFNESYEASFTFTKK